MTTAATTSALLAHELRDTIGRLVRRVRGESGPSVARLAVLGRLDREGSSSVSALAAAEHMRPQSMAEIVRGLEQAGEVSRRPDPEDGRRLLVELTNAGLELLEYTRRQRETWLTVAIERELDDHERAVVHEALLLLGRLADA